MRIIGPEPPCRERFAAAWRWRHSDVRPALHLRREPQHAIARSGWGPSFCISKAEARLGDASGHRISESNRLLGGLRRDGLNDSLQHAASNRPNLGQKLSETISGKRCAGRVDGQIIDCCLQRGLFFQR